jgi:hypothetical protein
MYSAAAPPLLLLAATGCVLSLDSNDTQSGCTDDLCPAGYTCEAGQCVRAAADAGATPDAAAPGEISLPDAAQVAVQSCDEQFGAAPSYNLCGEEPTRCEFFSQTDGTTCADLCALYDSECVDAYDSSAGTPCTVESQDGCLAGHNSQTCICTLAGGQ